VNITRVPILAIEARTKALGFMKTPKDNYTLVGIYFNVGQIRSCHRNPPRRAAGWIHRV